MTAKKASKSKDGDGVGAKKVDPDKSVRDQNDSSKANKAKDIEKAAPDTAGKGEKKADPPADDPKAKLAEDVKRGKVSNEEAVNAEMEAEDAEAEQPLRRDPPDTRTSFTPEEMTERENKEPEPPAQTQAEKDREEAPEPRGKIDADAESQRLDEVARETATPAAPDEIATGFIKKITDLKPGHFYRFRGGPGNGQVHYGRPMGTAEVPGNDDPRAKDTVLLDQWRFGRSFDNNLSLYFPDYEVEEVSEMEVRNRTD